MSNKFVSKGKNVSPITNRSPRYSSLVSKTESGKWKKDVGDATSSSTPIITITKPDTSIFSVTPSQTESSFNMSKSMGLLGSLPKDSPSSETKQKWHVVALTKEEEREFKEIFNLVDKDHGGSISKVELGQLMETLAISASQQEIDMMVSEIDKNNDGEIQFEEFVAVMSRKVQASYTADEVKAAFKVFENGAPPGYIKVDTLERALKTYGSDRLSKEQVQELLNQVKCDSNGLFNYIDFVNEMLADS